MDIFVTILEQGLIYGILALGVYITYKILDFPDLTVDGSFPLGAAVTATMITQGVNPYLTIPVSFLAGAAACEVDKQGRILIPQVLREFASLEKEVVLVGVANRVEIWSRTRWQESMEAYDDDMDEVAENMEELGFSI